LLTVPRVNGLYPAHATMRSSAGGWGEGQADEEEVGA
jgi:hypothetical protein